MQYKSLMFVTLSCFVAFPLNLIAEDDPVEARHELMEHMGDSAGTLGGMLKGETEFDSAAAMASLKSMQEGASVVGGLFPEGSFTGGEKKAAETVWTDRAGFDSLLAEFSAALDAAIAANPQSLDELKPVASGVFKNCKACHEDYRIPGE